MTLIFSLLRKDHIIFASDRRHVKGDVDGRYSNDACWKTDAILHGSAMLGFAGHDVVEQIIDPLRREGKLEGDSIKDVAYAISRFAKEKYSEFYPDWALGPSIEIMVAGFLGDLATCYVIALQSLNPMQFCFDADQRHDNFVLIGKRFHGALYAMRKFGNKMDTIEAGTRLACFTLAEVGKYDTTVGGLPQVCIIRPDQKVEDRSGNLQDEMAWVKRASEQLDNIFTLP